MHELPKILQKGYIEETHLKMPTKVFDILLQEKEIFRLLLLYNVYESKI